jgi:hypothetical protein
MMDNSKPLQNPDRTITTKKKAGRPKGSKISGLSVAQRLKILASIAKDTKTKPSDRIAAVKQITDINNDRAIETNGIAKTIITFQEMPKDELPKHSIRPDYVVANNTIPDVVGNVASEAINTPDIVDNTDNDALNDTPIQDNEENVDDELGFLDDEDMDELLER